MSKIAALCWGLSLWIQKQTLLQHILEVLHIMKKAIVLVIFVLAVSRIDDGAELVVARLTSWARTTTRAAAAQAAMLRTAAHSAPATAALPMPAAMPCGDRTPALCTARPSLSATAASTLKFCPAASPAGSQEVGGILLCLSCHDGNLTQSNMMQNWSYEQQIGLLTNTTYGSAEDSDPARQRRHHCRQLHQRSPGGPERHHQPAAAAWFGPTTAFTVTPGTPYAQFVANYGWPALAPGKWSKPYGVNGAGKPYVLCTTCHNQHVMTVYTSIGEQPDRGRRRRQVLCHLLLRQRPVQPEPAGQARLLVRRPRRLSSAVSATSARRTKPTTPTTSPTVFQ